LRGNAEGRTLKAIAPVEGPYLSTKPWPFRALVWYYRHPLLGYFILFVFGTLWAISTPDSGLLGLSLLAMPWLTIVLVILNLPLLGAAIQRLTLPLPVRRNHALEHGTIQLIRHAYGVTKGIGGKAAMDGFRISGARSQCDIESAFADFVALPPHERRVLAVVGQCGSMLVVAQGLGVALISGTLLVAGVWRPQPQEIGILLGVQFLLFLFGRRPLGRLLQEKRLLALDFRSARIQRIDRVRARHLIESSPVFFVRTVIDSASTNAPDPRDL
jgi:Domain of unknown function (DUF6391)